MYEGTSFAPGYARNMSQGLLSSLLARVGLSGGQDSGGAPVRFVDPATALEWHRSGAAVIVDVREPHEHRAGHVPGALSNPLSRFNPAAVPAAGDRPLVLHCQGGMRCGPASEKLRAAGYAGPIHRLRGGFGAWVAAGGPVEAGG